VVYGGDGREISLSSGRGGRERGIGDCVKEEREMGCYGRVWGIVAMGWQRGPGFRVGMYILEQIDDEMREVSDSHTGRSV
jgi:hypothetical protein